MSVRMTVAVFFLQHVDGRLLLLGAIVMTVTMTVPVAMSAVSRALGSMLVSVPMAMFVTVSAVAMFDVPVPVLLPMSVLARRLKRIVPMSVLVPMSRALVAVAMFV